MHYIAVVTGEPDRNFRCVLLPSGLAQGKGNAVPLIYLGSQVCAVSPPAIISSSVDVVARCIRSVHLRDSRPTRAKRHCASRASVIKTKNFKSAVTARRMQPIRWRAVFSSSDRTTCR